MADGLQNSDPGDVPKENQPEHKTDTQNPEFNVPPTNEGGHGTNQRETLSNTSDSTPDEGAEDKEEVAQRREEGKLQQVQKEVKELQQYKQLYDNIVVTAKESPEKYKQALIDFNGASEEEANLEVQRMIANGEFKENTPVSENIYGISGQSDQSQGTQQLNPTQVAQMAEQVATQKYQQFQQQQQVQKAFWDRIPEMNPNNVPQEQKQDKAILASAIEYAAAERVKKDTSVDIVDALVDAYSSLTGKTKEQLEEAKEEGRVEGYMQRNIDNADTGSAPKGYSPKESSFGLSKEDLQLASNINVSAERFAELKNNPETTVG